MNIIRSNYTASGAVLYTRFSLNMEMSRLTRDGTAKPVSRDQTLRRERGQGNIRFPSSADHDQDWQPYPVDPYSCYRGICHDHDHDHTYIHTVNKYLQCDVLFTYLVC